eukprot:1835395-Prymnesium_polylepis.1
MARESAHRVGPRQSAAETGDEHSRREGRGTEGWRQAVVRDRAQEAMGSWPRVPAARVQTLVCEEQHTSCGFMCRLRGGRRGKACVGRLCLERRAALELCVGVPFAGVG